MAAEWGSFLAGVRVRLARWVRPIHDAIFDAFVDDSALDGVRDVLAATRERVWQEISSSFPSILLLAAARVMSVLRWRAVWRLLPGEHAAKACGSSSQVRRLLRAGGWRHPSPKQRFELLAALCRVDSLVLRRVGFTIRLLYTSRIFALELAEQLSGLPTRGNEESPESAEVPNLAPPLLRGHWQELGEVDTIVVGSGASGAVVARVLHDRGERVLVVERGPFVLPGAINTRDNLSFFEGGGLRPSIGNGFFFSNAQVVGGGSTVHVDMAMPPTAPFIRHQFDTWHRMDLIPEATWNPEDVADAYTWVEQFFPTRRMSEEQLNGNNAAVRRGAERHGVSTEWFQLSTHEPGKSPYSVTDKRTTLDSLLMSCLQDRENPTTLLPDTEVLRVLIEGGRAVGVEVRACQSRKRRGIVVDPNGLGIPAGERRVIKAKRVVLAAGTLGTTTVLLRSRIRNQHVGRGFVAHPFMPVLGTFREAVYAQLGVSSSIFVDGFLPTAEFPDRPGYLMEPAAGPPDFASLCAPGLPSDIVQAVKCQAHIAGMAMLLIDKPDPRNRITLDPFGLPSLSYRLCESEARRFARGIGEAARILFKAGAEKVALISYEDPFDRGFDQPYLYLDDIRQADILERKLRFSPYQNLVMGAHMMAANKMSKDPESGVVGPNGGVWGVEGLYIADASVYPGSVGANPIMTIMTTAKLLADGLPG